MILDFDSTYIEIIRGDTVSLKLNLNSGTRENPEFLGMPAYSTLEVYIIPPNEPIEGAVIKKEITSEDIEIGNTPELELSAEESALLEIGKYYLTIKLLQKVTDTSSEPGPEQEPEVHVKTLVNNKLIFVTGIPMTGGMY